VGAPLTNDLAVRVWSVVKRFGVHDGAYVREDRITTHIDVWLAQSSTPTTSSRPSPS